MKKTIVLSVANQKGGVGKTTTCVNLGAALVEEGKKVLLLDNDPQANLSSYLSIGKTNLPERATLDELYLSKRPPSLSQIKEQFLQSYQVSFDYIGADKSLAGVEHYLFSKPDREQVLKKHLEPLMGEYDFILIDNPPSLNLLALNALCASWGVLVPVQTEFFSLEGIAKMQETIKWVQERWNPSLKIAGILPTQVDSRKKLTGEVLALLERNFPKELLNSKIRENSKLSESTGHGKTIFKYAATSAGAQDYRALAEEILDLK